jgi:hypothetical protein
VGELLVHSDRGWLGDTFSSFIVVFVLAAVVATLASVASGRLAGVRPTVDS